MILLILVLAFALKKLNITRGYQMKDLELLGGTSLGKRNKLVLVKVADQKLLLGVTDTQINTLHVFDKSFKQEYEDKIDYDNKFESESLIDDMKVEKLYD